LTERGQRLRQFFDRLEVPHPQQVLLERANESLSAAIALRGSDESGRTLDAEERDLLLEVVRDVLRTVIVPHSEATGDSA